MIKNNTSAKVYLHSCGDVSWAIKDFIECGIDILNPVQVGASNMDSKKLKKEFGNDITFWGGACDPEVLLRGSTKDVVEEVKRRINDLAPNGGFIFASIHSIQANTPPENIDAMITLSELSLATGKQSSTDFFRDKKLGFLGVLSITNLNDIRGSEYEQRASMDLLFQTAIGIIDDVGWIDKFGGTGVINETINIDYEVQL